MRRWEDKGERPRANDGLRSFLITLHFVQQERLVESRVSIHCGDNHLLFEFLTADEFQQCIVERLVADETLLEEQAV